MKMKWPVSISTRVLSILLLGTVLISCSTSSYINLNYRLPAEFNQFQGKKVFIKFKDMRPYSTIFGRRANEEFKYFTGNFSLTLVHRSQEEYLAGAFKLPALFSEAVKRRLEAMQVQILPQETEKDPVAEILLREFMLDLRGRQWMASMAFEIKLSINQKVLNTESVSGRAERTKIIGKGDAEKLLSELFTDVINRLDLYRLFQGAKS